LAIPAAPRVQPGAARFLHRGPNWKGSREMRSRSW
jgi:hypothetical protein